MTDDCVRDVDVLLFRVAIYRVDDSVDTPCSAKSRRSEAHRWTRVGWPRVLKVTITFGGVSP